MSTLTDQGMKCFRAGVTVITVTSVLTPAKTDTCTVTVS